MSKNLGKTNCYLPKEQIAKIVFQPVKSHVCKKLHTSKRSYISV